MAVASTIGMISADSHVNEPRNLWLDNLPRSMTDQAMQGIRSTEDGGWTLILDGRHIGKTGSTEQERLEVLKPERRFEVMRAEGVAGECIFPGIGLYVWMLKDPDGGKMSCRVYNEWIHDTLQRHSRRFSCAGLVPTWRVDDAVAEIHYIAEKGLGSAMLPAMAEVTGAPAYNHRDWEPMWKALEETRLPVVVHQGTGHDMVFNRGPGATVANLLTTQSMAPRVATLLATSGVLQAHPDLHFVFVEYNTGWLGWMMDTVDFYTESFARYDKPDSPQRWIYPHLSEPPSFYARRQIHATFQKDTIGLRNIDYTGIGAVMWGNDFPHEEGTYPNSRTIVDELAASLDEKTATRVFRENAAEVFGFDADAIAALP